MKTLLSITITLFFFMPTGNAQNKSYENLWKQVEKLEIEGSVKSALAVVEEIGQAATQEGNDQQRIKVLLFKSKFALILEEDAEFNIVKEFKEEIAQSNVPKRNILENLLAKMYWDYYQHHRYQYYDRTKTTSKTDEDDFRTWDLQTLFSEVQLLYENSLKNGLLLQMTSIQDYSDLLISYENSTLYRPTLFDFLSHNALEFYKSTEGTITRPAFKFEISDANLMSVASRFSALPITSQDSTSVHLLALQTYQNLMKFHQKDANPLALANVDEDRLQFVYSNGRFPNKESIYQEALETSIAQYPNNPEASALYSYALANLYYQQGTQYLPKTQTKYQWKNKEALAICNDILAKTPNSIVAAGCQSLKQNILASSMSITTEAFLPIQQNSKILVSYKNYSSLHLKILRLTHKQLKTLNNLYKRDARLEFIKKLPLVKQWDAPLTNENDYQSHTTELLIPPLDNGTYLIVGSDTPEWDAKPTYKSFSVTNIAVIIKQEKNREIYQAINRNDGQPLAGATFIASYQTNRNNIRTKKYTANANGEIRIVKEKRNYRSPSFEITYKDEVGYFDQNYYSFNEAIKKDVLYEGFVFTDRIIYRPGQTVYFKGIALKTEDGKSEVFANKEVYLEVYDANGDSFKDFSFTTNEYGSISGEFIIPSGLLTGSYEIEFYSEEGDINKSTSFSVEEYKRPKFEADFNPISETYKVNDSITVTGNALAFSGSKITDAKVVYRVKRNVQYPRWYGWSRPWYNSEAQEISFGETATAADGSFDIVFKALPDLAVEKDNLPIFTYEVTADITDVNGETRSANTTVKVGYHALLLSGNISEKIDKTNKKNSITISTNNLNGEFISTKGTVAIYKLTPPSNVLRKRPWPAPDYNGFTQEKFTSLFPHEAFGGQDDFRNWERGELMFSESFDTGKSKDLALGKIKKWPSGKYVVVLESKDKFGQQVKDIQHTTLFGKDDKILADNQLFSISTDKKEYAVGDQVQLQLVSAGVTHVTVDIEKDHAIVQTYIIPLANNRKSITIPIAKEDLGGFVVHYSYGAYNGVSAGTIPIYVPHPETDLTIETLSFRDKLTPGQEETWSFKIKGAKGEKVAAEMLASMYDASLDQFQAHNWAFNPGNNSVYNSVMRHAYSHSFGTQTFYLSGRYNRFGSYDAQRYDRFNWFGFSINNQGWVYGDYLNSLRRPTRSSYNTGLKEGTVEGTIYDDSGQPIPGVSVLIKGTTNGTQTDFDGHFSISVEKGQVLVFSYVGFSSLEQKIGKNNTFDINLRPDGAELSEVVVTAQGIKREKKALGYAVMSDGLENDAESIIRALPAVNARVQDSIQFGFNVQSALIKKANFDDVVVRKNLQETAFFFPKLYTDADSNISFSFASPEALTRWKLLLLAHTKTVGFKVQSFEAVTQKELMVVPNAPRFLREGDQITISSKIANLSETGQQGDAILQLTDGITNKSIDAQLSNSNNGRSFTVDAGGNTQVSWTLDIPEGIGSVLYKVIAKTENFSDGEQNMLPVLSNRMMVTETLPMWVRSNQTKTFSLDKLKNNTSTTLRNHKLTLEITSNPAWYAVQALPYLMEYPYDCNEQTFSRYYANSLAKFIVDSNPRIKEVFDQWKNTDALLSNLEKNQELKSLLIQETPWLRDAQSETEQKKRIALLFDLAKMDNELLSASNKLRQNQFGNGSWPWFNGGRENRYITQHIAMGFGHLKKLGVPSPDDHVAAMIQKAVQYLDLQFLKEYKHLLERTDKEDLSEDHTSYTQLHYLYMRSFFPDIKKSSEVEEASQYYLGQIKKYWLSKTLYQKGQMALILKRANDTAAASKILNSLKETSIVSEELGMYWKENTNSWYWYQAPIETQALLIETFSEVENDTATIDNLKIWLLKNKQTNQWKTTKATTTAVYALLLEGSDWLSVSDMVDVIVGDTPISPTQLEDVKVEAGTGYYKTSWSTAEITSEMANVTLSKKGNGVAWGGLYWQYFEDLDKITTAETSLQIDKKLFLKKNTAFGEEITEVTTATDLNVGDLIRVRIEIRNDRAMEYVHMKDMRAAGLEPINVLSQYKWQDGLGYYEATKDASTNFFFDVLPKGVFVFEYDLRVNNAGHFGNGITTIQSMYAPEFSSHSEGIRINVN